VPSWIWKTIEPIFLQTIAYYLSWSLIGYGPFEHALLLASKCGDWGNLPSPQQLGINTARPGTSSTQGKLQRNVANQLTIAGKPKPKVSTGFKRVVFLAHFEDQEIVKTHTVHFRLRPEDCNVNVVAKLVKEYLSLHKDLVSVDIHEFEIMDTDSTRGKS